MNNQQLIRLDSRPSPPPTRRLPVLQRDFADYQDNQGNQEGNGEWWAHRSQGLLRTGGVNISIPTASCSSDTSPGWLARRQQNKANSILYQLPEEILLKIRDAADPVTRTAMRCSCGLLLRIVADGDICPATRGPVVLSTLAATGFDDIIANTRCAVLPFPGCATCTTCVYRRASIYLRHWAGQDMMPVWPLPSSLDSYSWVQRSMLRDVMARDRPRRCDHCIAIRRSPLFRAHRQAATAEQFCVDCRESHGRHLFTQEMSPGRTPHRLCIYQASSVYVNVCRHEKVSYQSQARAVGPYTVKCNSTPPCDSEVSCQFTEPTTLYSSKLAFRLDPDVPLTREHIRRFLAQTRGQPESLGQFCPHVKPWDGRLMLPFMPDQCACFPDPPSTHYGANHAKVCACCRCQTTRADLDYVDYYDVSSEQDGDETERNHCFMMTKHSHRYRCKICEALYIWDRGPGGQDVFFSSYRYTGWQYPGFGLTDRSQWLRLVDPNLWLTGNAQAKHILWCDTPGCSTTRLWRTEFLASFGFKSDPQAQPA